MRHAYELGPNPQPVPSSPFEGAPTEKVPFSVVSIIALVAPLLCCSPLGLILSGVGFVQTKDGKMRGRRVAIAALIVNLLVLAFTVVAVVEAPETGPDGREVVTKENAHKIANQLEKEVDADR